MRNDRALFPFLRTQLGRAFIIASIGLFFGLVLFWTSHTQFSEACLQIKTPGSIAQGIARGLIYQQSIEDVITSMGDRLNAQWVGSFLYDEDQRRRFSFAIARIGVPVSATYGWLDIQQEDIYLEQLDYHKLGQCWVKSTKDLPEGLLKQQLEPNNIQLTISCPILAQNGDTFGYVAFGFDRVMANKETVAESIRASPIFAFDASNAGFFGN